MYKHPHRNIKNNDQISEHHGPVKLTHKMNHHTLLAPEHVKWWQDRFDPGLSSAKLWLSFSPEMGIGSFLFFIFKGFFFFNVVHFLSFIEFVTTLLRFFWHKACRILTP